MKDNRESFQTKSRKEIADEYNVCTRTFRRWIKKKGIVLPSGLVRPANLEKIYQIFGRPRK